MSHLHFELLYKRALDNLRRIENAHGILPHFDKLCGGLKEIYESCKQKTVRRYHSCVDGERKERKRRIFLNWQRRMKSFGPLRLKQSMDEHFRMVIPK